MKYPPQELCTLPWSCPTSAFPVPSFLFLCEGQTRTRKWLGSRLVVRSSPPEWLTDASGWSEHLHCHRERMTILSPPSAEQGFKSGLSLHVLDSCCRLPVGSGFYWAEYFTQSLGLETGPVAKKACCSCEAPEFGSQLPHQAVHNLWQLQHQQIWYPRPKRAPALLCIYPYSDSDIYFKTVIIILKWTQDSTHTNQAFHHWDGTTQTLNVLSFWEGAEG